MTDIQITPGKFYRTRQGLKVGPMRIVHDVARGEGGESVWAATGRVSKHGEHRLDLVSEWMDGPVREVTRMEIVDGVYGNVRVMNLSGASDRQVGVRLHKNGDNANVIAMTADELRNAAATFIELANALSQPS